MLTHAGVAASAPPAAETLPLINRELSWLRFAERVLAQTTDPEVPLLERVRFAGIVGMLHDEFFMRRISGLKREIDRGSTRVSPDGMTPREEFDACRRELLRQSRALSRIVDHELRPALVREGHPIVDHADFDAAQRREVRTHFQRSIEAILTPPHVR